LGDDNARFFSDEIHAELKHSNTGTVAMASFGENLNASQVSQNVLLELPSSLWVRGSTFMVLHVFI